MDRKSAHDGRDMVSALRLFSTRMRKGFISEKVWKARVLSLLKSGCSVKIRFGFWGFLSIFGSKIKDKK